MSGMTTLAVDRATLHEHAHRTPWADESMHVSPPLAELDVPASGVGWVKSEPHDGETAERAIVLWSGGLPVWVSGERTVHRGDWVGVKLPLTVEMAQA
jgi:hypothetical protein